MTPFTLPWPLTTPCPDALLSADGGRCGVLVVRHQGAVLDSHTRSWLLPVSRRMSAASTDADWRTFNAQARLRLDPAARPCLCVQAGGLPLVGCPGCRGTGVLR